MPQYTGLESVCPTMCPSCRKTGYVSTQRWNGIIEKHCNRCGVSFDPIGSPKQPEPDTQHIRTEQIAAILTRCIGSPKIGTNIIRKIGASKELIADCAAAGLLHLVAPDVYLTSSRGKRFLQTRRLIINLARKEANQ
jgi:hypothetical protein